MTEPLKDELRQWLTIAESDFRAYSLLAAEEMPPVIAVCFHCQQYIEKLVKAVLTVNRQEAPRTHDLRNLSITVIKYVPDIKPIIDDIAELTVYGVETRYPAATEISEEEMRRAVNVATQAGQILKKYLFKHLK